MAKGISFNKAFLSYKETAEAADYTKLVDLQEIPDIGASPEKIDVTTLDSENKESINGIGDPGDLAFKFLYNSGTKAPFAVLKGLEAAGEVVAFKLTLTDGSSFSFNAFVSVVLNGGSLNSPVQFTLNLTVNSKITYAGTASK